MNGNSLYNLSFTTQDRAYLRYHIETFHPNASENQYGFVKNKGYSIKTPINLEILDIFNNNRNT